MEVLFVENSRDPSAPVVTFAKGHGLDGPWGIAVGKMFLYYLPFGFLFVLICDLESSSQIVERLYIMNITINFFLNLFIRHCL